MEAVAADISYLHVTVLIVSVAIAFGFEIVNGFHDSATAVATVIYTRSLPPTPAVIWSGIWNGLGVLYAMATGLAVAFSIVHLLPVDLLVSMGTATGLTMVFSLLAAAMLWNLGTWYFGLPVSSSHTLIGSVLGVGLAAAWMSGRPLGDAVNWAKAGEVFRALIFSPAVGFLAAGALLILTARVLRDRRLFEAPAGDRPPPFWIRTVLILSCTGVSFAHGSNDGQKGIGLIMLVLMGSLPGVYALNVELSPTQSAAFHRAFVTVEETVGGVAARTEPRRGRPNQMAGGDHVEWTHITLTSEPIAPTADAILSHLHLVRTLLPETAPLGDLRSDERWRVRQGLLRLSQAVGDFAAAHADVLDEGERLRLRGARQALRPVLEFAPTWVGVGVALCLAFGSMIGWRRVVVTVGEKIGQKPLTYAQGACAQITTMATIMSADAIGLPVSTTHVLSGGIAGTMVAERAGLQRRTVASITAAWVVTLPASMALSAILYTSLSQGLPGAQALTSLAGRLAGF